MERRTPLRSDPAKTRAWQDRSRVTAAVNAATRARKALKRTRLAPVGKAPKGKRGEDVTPQVKQLMAMWATAARGQPCANPVCRTTRYVEGAHVLSQQSIRRIARTLDVDPHRFLWDRRNLLPLCSEPAPNRCHERHDNAVVRLPRDLVPESAVEFCDELDDMLEAAGKPREAITTLLREWPDAGR